MQFWSLYPRELVLNVNVQTEVMALAWTTSTLAQGILIAIGIRTEKPGYCLANAVVEVAWL